jgi:hypothetical protein
MEDSFDGIVFRERRDGGEGGRPGMEVGPERRTTRGEKKERVAFGDRRRARNGWERERRRERWRRVGSGHSDR